LLPQLFPNSGRVILPEQIFPRRHRWRFDEGWMLQSALL
jgi:hypothetical protein